MLPCEPVPLLLGICAAEGQALTCARLLLKMCLRGRESQTRWDWHVRSGAAAP